MSRGGNSTAMSRHLANSDLSRIDRSAYNRGDVEPPTFRTAILCFSSVRNPASTYRSSLELRERGSE